MSTRERLDLPNDQNASGRTLGEEELGFLSEAIASGTLTSTKGSQVKALEREFAAWLGGGTAWACTSGSAAIHCAVAAIDPEPGEEVITTPITDMGALTPIVYQGAIPVFADVDPDTGNVTAETIAARLSERTRAIVVTHLFGNPCVMEPIVALAAEKGIPIIEDCAQAYGARVGETRVGRFGAVGCFSFQQGKHMTTGEGGVVSSEDEAIARRLFLFINKAWGYGDAKPDHYFLALNYRMSELQGAVARGQLAKLEAGIDARIAAAEALNAKLQEFPGLTPPVVAPGARHGYWRYTLMVDPEQVPGGAVGLGAALREQGIACAPRYIQKPAFHCQVFRERRTFGKSQWPFTLARPEALDWAPERFVGATSYLERVLVLPWNERYTLEHADYLADVIREAAGALQAAA